MRDELGRTWRWMADAPQHMRGARLLRVGLGCALLFRAATESRWAAVFYGPSGWALPHSAVTTQTAALAQVFSSDVRVYAALTIMGLSGIFLALGKAPRLFALIALVPYWLLYNRLGGFGDAGDNLIRLLLLYSLLLNDPRSVRPAAWRTWCHNLGVILILAQASMLYFSSGMMKLKGEGWLDGTAAYMASLDQLLVGDVVRAALRLPWVTVPVTYGVLLMELWYPIAIWSKARRPFLLLVLAFHLATIFTLRIVTFGCTMIALNLFVIADAEHARIAEALKRWLDIFRGRATPVPIEREHQRALRPGQQ